MSECYEKAHSVLVKKLRTYSSALIVPIRLEMCQKTVQGGECRKKQLSFHRLTNDLKICAGQQERD